MVPTCSYTQGHHEKPRRVQLVAALFYSVHIREMPTFGCSQLVKQTTSARWWFQRFFIFIPTWGTDPIWPAYFFTWVGSTTNQGKVDFFRNQLVDPKVFFFELGGLLGRSPRSNHLLWFFESNGAIESLMVWFRARWFGIRSRGAPIWTIPFVFGDPRNPNHQLKRTIYH